MTLSNPHAEPEIRAAANMATEEQRHLTSMFGASCRDRGIGNR
jgi:hypothetical protein